MKNIMTVDDSPSLRQMVGLVLRGASYQVIEAVDGVNALSKLSGQELHLFLVDVNMPNMAGWNSPASFERCLNTSSSQSSC